MKENKTIKRSIVGTLVILGTVASIGMYTAQSQAAFGTGTENFDSLRIGQAGVGGVTFFNGTAVNEGGAFVIGDHLRVDGNIHRGPEHGIEKGDNKPLRFNDEVVSMGKHTFNKGLNFLPTAEVNFEGAVVQNFPGYDHNHDDRYYTESETDSKVDSKVDKSNPEWDARTGYASVDSLSIPFDRTNFEYESYLTTKANNGAPSDIDLTAGGIQLPHGATITELIANVIDDTSDAEIEVALLRTPNTITGIDPATLYKPPNSSDPLTAYKVASLRTTATGTSTIADQSTTSIDGAVVDNSTYSYMLAITFIGTEVRKTGFLQGKVKYTYNAPH